MSFGGGTRVAGQEGRTSSPELSSPPKSESERGQSHSPRLYAQNSHNKSNISSSNRNVGGGVLGVAGLVSDDTNHSSLAINPAPAPPRKSRKKRETKESKESKESKEFKETANSNGAETKSRKPRRPVDGSAPARKKLKTENGSDDNKSKKATSSAPQVRQSKITDILSHPTTSSTSPNYDLHHSSQNGNLEAITKNTNNPSTTPTLSHAQPSTMTNNTSRSSGQRYDPVRSTTVYDPPSSHTQFSAPQSPNIGTGVNNASNTTTRSVNRASESPSIASLIDPPTQPQPQSHVSYPSLLSQNSAHSQNGPSYNHSPTSNAMPSPSTIHVQSYLTPAAPNTSTPVVPGHSSTTPMDIDEEPPAKAPAKKVTNNESQSRKPSPPAKSPAIQPTKPARQREPITLPSGSGLLSTNIFGGAFESSSETNTTPNIIIHVPLKKGEFNTTVNFLEMAKKKYGADALNPRLAAHKKRMARIAAASSALERNEKSGGTSDDMSVDLSDPDLSNLDGAVGDEPEEPAPKSRKKASKLGNYDRDDPFIDDSEELWLEQAAASKDGFFVYSGPLVPEGEKPTIERADGTVPRGRGRGSRGGRGGRGGARGATSAATSNGHASATSARTTGGGAGGSSGTVQRKPRMTKAARQQMEKEKNDREKMAVLAAKPPNYPGPVGLAGP
ncbi:MAG: hypothetical protein M1834_008867 [Cirrosporium novae-zelandiae]|nr:MAG: hypothetical protein M1834_008867 [Cirrosporium novae-zelandiae]